MHAFATLLLLAATALAAPPAPPATTPAADPLTAALKKADVAYAKRRVAASSAALVAAAKLASGDFRVAWRMARHHFMVAARSSDDDVKKREGKAGWRWADKAIGLQPGRAAGYYWATTCVGEYSNGAGIFRSIREGIAGKFERYARMTIKRSPTYEQGGGYRALGRYYFKLPWPKRDIDKAIEYLAKAVRAGPVKARNYAWLAEAYLKEGEQAKAKRVLRDCLAKARPAAEDRADGVKFKRRCKKMLAGL